MDVIDVFFLSQVPIENMFVTMHSIQVETIGDAYCVAGGLHKESETHAVQIALMALMMMELSDDVMTPTGEPIQVREQHCFFDALYSAYWTCSCSQIITNK